MKDEDPRRMTPARRLRDAILAARGSDQAALIKAAAGRRDFPLSWIPRHLLCSQRVGDYSRNGNQG